MLDGFENHLVPYPGLQELHASTKSRSICLCRETSAATLFGLQAPDKLRHSRSNDVPPPTDERLQKYFPAESPRQLGYRGNASLQRNRAPHPP